MRGPFDRSYSPANVRIPPDLVRWLGAHEDLDYRDEQVIAKISKLAADFPKADRSRRRFRRRHFAMNQFGQENEYGGTIVIDVLVWCAFVEDHSRRRLTGR